MPLNKHTNIVWTDHTYNYWRACAKVSEGCKLCWAENMMTRFKHTTEPWTIEHIEDQLHVYDENPNTVLDVDPAWIFTPSASDPFLPWLPDSARDRWLEGLHANPQHCYQILTKWGAENFGIESIDLPANAMLGVSCESPRRLYRLDWLREQDASMKFVSFEPLIEKIPQGAVDLTGIDWIIVGGESHGDPEERRDMGVTWPIELYKAAREQDVKYLFKQHSGPFAEQNRVLNTWDGPMREYNEFPETPSRIPDAPQDYMTVV